jgi:hypothetical protein
MAGLDGFEEDKIFCPYLGTNPGPIIQLQVYTSIKGIFLMTSILNWC